MAFHSAGGAKRPPAPVSTFDPTQGLEDARQAALREVARLLATPDDVAKLETIRADAAARRLAAEGALSSALGAQVAEAMTGRSKLDGAQASLRALQARLRDIDALCSACRDLVRHDELVRELATVRVTLGATLERATTILDLPEEAAETLAALEKETELVVVFEELVALDAKCLAAQRLFEDGDERGGNSHAAAARRGRNIEHRARVASYFQRVDAARETFEARLWAQLRTAVHMGDSGAANVVRVLRVVQEQEAMDVARAADVRVGEVPPQPRRYRAAALGAVEASIDERCAKLLPDPLLPTATEEGGEEEVVIAELLMDVQDCFRALQDIYDFIVPCFPADYDVWQVAVRRYHARVAFFYDRLAALAAPPSNADILEVVRCHEEYTAMLRDLDVPDTWYAIKAVPALPVEAPPEDSKGKGKRGRPQNTRDAVAAVEADARARAKEAAAAAGGNWEGAAVVPVDAAARALLTGIALDTAGLTVNIASGLASGTIGVVKGVGNLVTGKLPRWGGGGSSDSIAALMEDAPPAPPPPPPSAALWQPGTGDGWGRLLDLYVRRMRDATSVWMSNMVAADLTLPDNPDWTPDEAEGGKLFTPAGVDFFRILNDQLEAVTAVTRGELLVRVVVAISALMLDFTRMQNAAVERPDVQQHVLCAYINNNNRCYDMSTDILESLKELTEDDEHVSERLEVLTLAHDGFFATAHTAVRKLIDSMFADVGFAAAFSDLFTSAEWWSGALCDTLCATVLDYFADFSAWTVDNFFRVIAQAAMERTVATYCAALFVQCATIKTGTMARIAADEEALRATFAPYVAERPLATAFQTLADLRELACASTEAEIQSAFGTMLGNAPGTTVDVVERILAMREDIPKPVKKQIVHSCSEQWHARNGTVSGGLAAAAAALGGATAATAAAIQDAIKVAVSRSRWFG